MGPQMVGLRGRRAHIAGRALTALDLSFNQFGDESKINGMNAYIGVGMNSRGNTPSFEIMLAYDLNLQAIYKNNLINGRFGFTLFY